MSHKMLIQPDTVQYKCYDDVLRYNHFHSALWMQACFLSQTGSISRTAYICTVLYMYDVKCAEQKVVWGLKVEDVPKMER